jgi:hypothetical protein
MKKRLTFKRTALALACICATNLTAIAQVGIGTTMPNANAALEVSSTAAENKGLLLPKVALTGTVSVAPLSAHVAGMTVYNTATVTDVTPGYYFNDGLKWIKMLGADSSLTAGKLINITGNTISKINNINVVTVTASLTIDADSFTEGIFRCDMTTINDFTLADFSNPSDGGVYSIHLIGANTGNVTFPGSFVREDGITALGTVNVAAGEMITFYHFGGTNYTMEQ